MIRGSHGVIASAGKAAGFNPATVTGFLHWLNAENVAGNDGDSISSVSVESGYNYAQSNASQQPLLKLNIVNGKKVLRFDGSNDCLYGSANITWGTKGTILMACNVTLNVSQNRYLYRAQSTATHHIITRFSTSKIDFNVVGGVTLSPADTTPVPAYGNWWVTALRYNFDTARADLYINSVSALCSDTDVAGAAPAASLLYIGGNTTQAQMDITDFIICNDAVSDTELADLMSYFKAKLGIA